MWREILKKVWIWINICCYMETDKYFHIMFRYLQNSEKTSNILHFKSDRWRPMRTCNFLLVSPTYCILQSARSITWNKPMSSPATSPNSSSISIIHLLLHHQYHQRNISHWIFKTSREVYDKSNKSLHMLVLKYKKRCVSYHADNIFWTVTKQPHCPWDFHTVSKTRHSIPSVTSVERLNGLSIFWWIEYTDKMC